MLSGTTVSVTFSAAVGERECKAIAVLLQDFANVALS